MTLANVRDWLSTQVTGADSITIGKLDTTKQKAIGIYNRNAPSDKIAIGGLQNTSTATKKICVLVHWTTNCNTAENKAQEIYNLFYGTQSTICGKKCFFYMDSNEPIGVGTDDKGIYEFTIDLIITYER